MKYRLIKCKKENGSYQYKVQRKKYWFFWFDVLQEILDPMRTYSLPVKYFTSKEKAVDWIKRNTLWSEIDLLTND